MLFGSLSSREEDKYGEKGVKGLLWNLSDKVFVASCCFSNVNLLLSCSKSFLVSFSWFFLLGRFRSPFELNILYCRR